MGSYDNDDAEENIRRGGIDAEGHMVDVSDVEVESATEDTDGSEESLCSSSDSEAERQLADIVLPLDTDPESAATEIKCHSHPFDICFHPSDDKYIIAAPFVSGDVALYRYLDEHSSAKFLTVLKHHDASCRCVKFFPQGDYFISASADQKCVIVDANGCVAFRVKAHDDGVNALEVLSDMTFASGDDSGVIKIWDKRQAVRCVQEFHEYEEYVSQLLSSHSSNYLTAVSGDTLGVYDLRQHKKVLMAMSDPLGHDLTALAMGRSDSKVIVGSVTGQVLLFSWGHFGTPDDGISGHSQAVNSMVALEDDVLLTGSGDGILRVVTIFPNRVAGVLGEVRDSVESIEAVALSESREVVATCSMDQIIRFYKTDKAFTLGEKSREERRRMRHEEPAAGAFFSEL